MILLLHLKLLKMNLLSYKSILFDFFLYKSILFGYSITQYSILKNNFIFLFKIWFFSKCNSIAYLYPEFEIFDLISFSMHVCFLFPPIFVLISNLFWKYSNVEKLLWFLLCIDWMNDINIWIIFNAFDCERLDGFKNQFSGTVTIVLPLPDPDNPDEHEACCPLCKIFYSQFSYSYIFHSVEKKIN